MNRHFDPGPVIGRVGRTWTDKDGLHFEAHVNPCTRVGNYIILFGGSSRKLTLRERLWLRLGRTVMVQLASGQPTRVISERNEEV